MLEGNRIKLRPVKESDLPQLRNWYNDYELRGTFAGGFNPLREKDYKKRFESKPQNWSHQFAITLKDSDQPIGTAGLRWEPFNSGRLGIVIGDTSNHRKGYGTEAIEILMRIGFMEMNLQKLVICTRSWNISAMKHAESLGFTQVLRERHVGRRNGKLFDRVCYDILREEYMERVSHD